MVADRDSRTTARQVRLGEAVRRPSAIDEFGEQSSELGQLLGERWREGTEREEQLVQLQASIERMTRWLVRLTVVLGVIGVGSIAATTWSALG